MPVPGVLSVDFVKVVTPLDTLFICTVDAYLLWHDNNQGADRKAAMYEAGILGCAA